MGIDLREAQEIQHEKMMSVSDYYCADCGEYWMIENMKIVVEPHGERRLFCPGCGSGEIEK